MRMPVKLNRSFWPKALTGLLPSSDDPRIILERPVDGAQFTKAISVFRFGATFKTTQHFRFPATIEALSSLDYAAPPTILDVGASDGSTSLHVIQRLKFEKLYITDLNPEALYDVRNGRCYFYDLDHKCILIVTKLFVVYSESNDSVFPFNKVAKHFFSKSSNTKNTLARIELINPEVRKADCNIVVAKYDIFERWMNDKVDLIIAANILNTRNFSDNQILKAIKNMVSALNDGGRFVIVDSRKNEEATIFRVSKKRIAAEIDINNGTEIRELVLNSQPVIN